MIYRALYQLFLPLGMLAFLPKILKKKKMIPPVKKKKFMIWVHAVSMGETVAVASIAMKLKELYGDEGEMIISSHTKTGHEYAKKNLSFADYHIYMPLDLLWVVKKYLKAAKPDIVVFSETDLWPNFLHTCKKQGTKLYLVNAKISPSSFSLYQKFRPFVQMTYGYFDLIFPQSIHYEDRFRALGLNQLKTCGNLKLDSNGQSFQRLKKGKEVTLCIGSTHAPEELWLLEIVKKFENLKVILAPRHPERVDEVEGLLKEMDISYALSSKGETSDQRVLLVDQMGILKECYARSDIAIVCGTFTDRVGGHNILEPCEYGVPVLYGPHIWSQPELDELIQEYSAGQQVTLEELSIALKKLIESPESRKIMGDNGRRLIEDNRGSSERTFNEIKKLALKNGPVI